MLRVSRALTALSQGPAESPDSDVKWAKTVTEAALKSHS
jgi:hypothetical protein